MTEIMLSVGIDLGTTTTQMILSRLTVENKASPFSVPRMEISGREILHRSHIYFTPLRTNDTLDAEKIRDIVDQEYSLAGIKPKEIQTGAVIITGETARKENAKAVLAALKDYAGKFVVATAGPALESVLAARGADADKYAAAHQTHVLHMDIGGGTTNLALLGPDGTVMDTGCVNVGGRLLKFDGSGQVTYRSPVLSGVGTVDVGERVDPEALKPLVGLLVQVLEEAAGLRKRSAVNAFITDKLIELPTTPVVLSFSGGVAELIKTEETDWLRYGDLGVLLGRAIRASELCRGSYILGQETVQATVVGAGSYATELSGSTVSHYDVEFPLQNLPVVTISPGEEEMSATDLGCSIEKKLRLYSDEPAVLFLRGKQNPAYADVQRLADGICLGVRGTERLVAVALQEDMAKALGQALRGRLGEGTPLICLDGLHLQEGSYLDIAAPLGEGTVIPVVIKTLAFM